LTLIARAIISCPLELLKYPAKYATFQQISATRCNNFLSHVSFSLQCLTLIEDLLSAKTSKPRLGYFFSMEMAAFAHRRYMSLIVMLAW
jgi:hypothetical protein